MPDGEGSRISRFGVFEIDLRTGELRRNGFKVRLQEQPFQILAMLLERPGELVSREDLRNKLWPSDTFVDFEHGLNAAIKRLRDALGESADTPAFIETIPRRGYRFIATPVQVLAPRAAEPQAAPETLPSSLATLTGEPRGAAGPRFSRFAALATTAVIAVLGAFVWLLWPLPAPRVLNTAQITHDGIPKQDRLLTDGSRLYFIETNGTRAVLAQVSVSGGDTSIIPTPFANISISDISPDHSRLLARDLWERILRRRSGVFPFLQVRLAAFQAASGSQVPGRGMAVNSLSQMALTFMLRTQMARIPGN